MRKYAVAVAGLSAAFGLAGYFLRKQELLEMYNDGTGLASAGTRGTVVLLAVTAAVLAAALLSAVFSARNYRSAPAYDRAFGMKSPVLLLPYVIVGAAAVAAAVLYWLEGRGAASAVDGCFAVLAVLSGLSVIVSAFSAYTTKRGLLSLASVIPAVFFCFWLVLVYKQHDTNPQLIEYVFMCLSPAALSLSVYYTAGYAYGKEAPGKLIFSHVLAIYFSFLTLADDWSRPEKLLLLALTCAALLNLYLFVGNMTRKADSDRKARQ